MTTTALPENIMIRYVQHVAYSRIAKYNLYVKELKPTGDDDGKETLLTLCTDDEKASFKCLQI